jgi:hypothetical protein
VVSGNGVNIYVGDPGILVQFPYYPCSFSQDVEPNEGISPVVVNVDFSLDTPGQGIADVAPGRGLVFNLLGKTDQGDEILMAQAAIPAGAVPDGSHGDFAQILEAGLPAALPDGVSFVGPAFTLGFTLPDGTPFTSLNEPMVVKFKIPDGFIVPSGQALSIYFFDGSTWSKLPVTISGGYVYATTSQTGTFILALGPA